MKINTKKPDFIYVSLFSDLPF